MADRHPGERNCTRPEAIDHAATVRQFADGTDGDTKLAAARLIMRIARCDACWRVLRHELYQQCVALEEVFMVTRHDGW